MLSKRQHCDVLIVGAGPVGLLLGLLLTKQRIGVRIVDEAWRSAGRSYAAAIHPSSLELLDEVGLAEAAISQASRVERVAFYEGSERSALADLSQLSSPFPFVAVLPQATLESLLEEQLRRHGVAVDWQHRVSQFSQSGSRVKMEVDVLDRVSTGYAYATTTLEIAKTLEVEAEFLVGADGHDSLVRRAERIDYESLGPVEEFDVFEFDSSLDLNEEVRVVLDEATTNVLWGLPGGRQRWSFQVREPGTTRRERVKSRLSMQMPGEASPRYTSEALRDLIAERAPWYEATVGDIAWAGDVRFECRLAKSFGSGRIWLAGDAAHQTGPVGVQSMNEGLLEAERLAQLIGAAVRKPARLPDLQSYGEVRHDRWQRLLGGADPFCAGPDASDWVRSREQRIVRALPVSGSHLDRVAADLGLEPTATSRRSQRA